jgi:gliding motility-associated-like protein
MKFCIYVFLIGLTFSFSTTALSQTYTLPANGTASISTTSTVCTGKFYDDGGPGNNYSNGGGSLFGGTHRTITFTPSVPGTKVKVVFTAFKLHPGGGLVAADKLTVTNNGTAVVYTGTTSPGTMVSTDPNGSLTFDLYIGDTGNEPGWEATISLEGPTISYAGSPYCKKGTTTANWSNGNALTGGTYSSLPAGLVLDQSTGVIDLAASAAATYAVTYTQGCYQVSAPVTIKPLAGSNSSHSICTGQAYAWNNQTLTTSGNYTATLISSTGCDSVASLTLTVTSGFSTTQSATICHGHTYTFGSQTLNTTGTYTEKFISSGGCDSTVTLSLTVSAPITSSTSATICNNESYVFGTQTLQSPGIYTEVFKAAGGCDSTVSLSLAVRNAITAKTAKTICSGQSYSFGTQVLNTAGTYTKVFPAQNGCDSTVELTLSLQSSILTSISGTICQGKAYTFGARQLNSPGTYTDTLIAQGGCDSIITLSLTVLPSLASGFSQTICNGDSFTFDNKTLSAQGIYTATFLSQNGCDSVVTLMLIALPAIADTTTADICAGQAYTFGSQVINSSGTCTHVFTTSAGCDSTVTLYLSVTTMGLVLQADSVSCSGESNGSIVAVASSGTLPYSYTINNSSGSSNIISGLAAGAYHVSVSDAKGCSASGNTTIYEPAPLQVYAKPSSLLLQQGQHAEVVLNSNNPNTVFSWSPSNGLQCTDCATNIIAADNDLTYTITATAGNCNTTIELPVSVTTNHDLFVPNLFSPNQDGDNDLYSIYGNLPAIKQIRFEVFNRWGELVYASKKLDFKWDGTYNGQALLAGIYTYFLDIVFSDGYKKPATKGTITLVR